MKKQGTIPTKEDFYQAQVNQLKYNNPHQPISQYIQFLRTQIRHLGQQIDSEFHRSSQFIFSLYKHYYSPSQCLGEKDTLLTKLSNCGVQWALQSSLQQKHEEMEVRSQEARQVNPTSQAKEQEISRRGYNMRAKTKPQKYRNMEEEYDYSQKNQKVQGPKRGRPTKKETDWQTRRDTTNPYEKAPYKKRRSQVQIEQDGNKDQSIRDDAARSSVKWDESQDLKEEGNDLGKSAHEMKSEIERDGNRDNTEKHIKSVEDVKAHGNKDELDHISTLVEVYKKNWEHSRFQLELQNDS